MSRVARALAAVAVCSTALAPGAARARPEPTAEDVGAFVDGIVAAELARSDVAGAVVVVVANGAPVLVRGYGFADVEKRAPVDARTLFRLASISKLFTSLAVLQLVERGELDLDADVNAYLDFTVPKAFGRPVTLRQLLTHRAGFEERLRDLGHANAPPIPLARFVRERLPRREREPERSPSYSNYGVALAGYIVERTARVPFERYVAENIFAPLGMQRASFEQPLPASLAPLVSQGYQVASEPPGPFEVINDAPAGALSASGDAMARFLRMLIGGGELDGVRVLSPESFARWTQPQVVIAGNALGLTIYESHPHGVRTLGHGGDLSYFHSELHALPERGFGVFVAQNSLGKSPRLLRAVLVPALVKRYFAETRREQPQAVTPGHAREVVGNYMTTRRSDASWMRLQGLVGQAVVSARDDTMIEIRGLADAAGNTERWIETAPYRFRSRDGEREIEFARDERGRVEELEPAFPGVTYERASFADSQTFALAVFPFAVLVTLWALLAPAAGRLARWALAAPPAPERSGAAPSLTLLTAAVWLGALATFATFTSAAATNFWRFSRGADGVLVGSVLAVWVAAALSAVCAFATARELRAGGPSRARRVARAVPALAFLALSWFAWNWGLLTDPTRY
ncbi:MAG: serine hydrolase domain-containing protein [Myxococcota bacterium]